VQQATRQSVAAKDSESQAKREAQTWEKKRVQFSGGASELDDLRAHHNSVQRERQQILQDLPAQRSEVGNVSERLRLLLNGRDATKERHQARLGECQNAAEAQRDSYTDILRKTKEEYADAFDALKLRYDEQAALEQDINDTLLGEARAALAYAEQDCATSCADRDRVGEKLQRYQQDGTELLRQWNDLKEHVLHIYAEIKDVAWRVQDDRELDYLLDMAYDAEHSDDEDIDELRQRCRLLERDAVLAEDALNKKEAECERWMEWQPAESLPHNLAFEQELLAAERKMYGSPLRTDQASPERSALALQRSSPSPTKLAPFTLGPSSPGI